MIIRADARHIPLADGSVQCIVTSPPYWGLRDYGTARWDGGDADHAHGAPIDAPNGNGGNRVISHPGRHINCPCGARRIDAQIGLEPTPEAYVATMVAVFREVRRVLRDDGTLWLNLGDSYASGGRDSFGPGTNKGQPKDAPRAAQPASLKPKDLCGMPWRVAFALQFLGSGTVGMVCERLGRRWAGLELSPEYIAIAKKRTAQRGLFSGGSRDKPTPANYRLSRPDFGGRDG